MDFKTVQAVHPAAKSHLNQVALDTRTWESAAAFQLESSPLVECYAKNDRLGLTIAYEYDGASHFYEPDFIVRLANKTTLVLEVKGYEPNQASAKHEAAKRWTAAVNNWGAMGKWAFHVCRNPQTLQHELAQLSDEGEDRAFCVG